MAHPADKWAAARFWLADHKGALGVPLGALLILGLAVLFIFPLAPPRRATGTVVGFGVEETRAYGTTLMAVVRLADTQAVVALPSDSGCRVGDRIELPHRRTLLGWSFTAATPTCPAR